MAYESYISLGLRPDSIAMVKQCNVILAEYMAQGLRVTLRQLYYQLVTRNIIANREQDYKKLGDLMSRARLAGLVDWDAIEDRLRRPVMPPEFKDLADLVEAALYSYRLPRWKGQLRYVELWVEKDALAGVLQPLAREYHVTLMVNRGYSSQSAMKESAERFRVQDKIRVLFYLGDHDPSGQDMVRDVGNRLDIFRTSVTVKKLALTMNQVRQYNPPPNPAKLTDPRADKYIAEHGGSSWEVDALPPNVLVQIIRTAFESVIDKQAMDEVKQQEETDKKRLRKAVQQLINDQGSQ